MGVRLMGMRGKTASQERPAAARGGLQAQGAASSGRNNGRPAGPGPATIGKTLGSRPAPSGGTGVPASTGESLEQSVFRSLEQYFANLDGAKPHALHEMVLGAIEKPLLQFALRRCEGNQSAAADLLGINRNTLRRKLQDYGLH